MRTRTYNYIGNLLLMFACVCVWFLCSACSKMCVNYLITLLTHFECNDHRHWPPCRSSSTICCTRKWNWNHYQMVLKPRWRKSWMLECQEYYVHLKRRWHSACLSNLRFALSARQEVMSSITGLMRTSHTLIVFITWSATSVLFLSWRDGWWPRPDARVTLQRVHQNMPACLLLVRVADCRHVLHLVQCIISSAS